MFKLPFAQSAVITAFLLFGFTRSFANASFINSTMNSKPIKQTNPLLTDISKSDTCELDSTEEKGNEGLNIKALFELKKPIEMINSFQYGLWFGNSIYGGGDIKHESLLAFSTEISYGAYVQYDWNNYLSFKANYYRSDVGMHNLFTTYGNYAEGKVPFTKGINGNEIQPYSNTNPLMFVTKMNVFDVEALWHFGNNVLRAGEKSRWVKSVGLSLGVFHYDPYRLNYIVRNSGESKANWDKRVWENERINLRELGLEGQNFVDGKEKYGKLASSLGLSWQLSYIQERWSFKGEMKAVYTSTDYLDDYGPGVWYGGDYERWLNSVLDNPEFVNNPSLFQNVNSPTEKFYYLSGGKDTHLKLAADAPRSTNGLNDWYYQFHVGVSYRIQPLVKNKVNKQLGKIELYMKR